MIRYDVDTKSPQLGKHTVVIRRLKILRGIFQNSSRTSYFFIKLVLVRERCHFKWEKFLIFKIYQEILTFFANFPVLGVGNACNLETGMADLWKGGESCLQK